MLLSGGFDTLPYQLELLERKLELCPRCNPAVLKDGGKPECLRSVCGRHCREMGIAFDRDAFRKSCQEALERGRKAAMEFRSQHGLKIGGVQRFT